MKGKSFASIVMFVWGVVLGIGGIVTQDAHAATVSSVWLVGAILLNWMPLNEDK